MKITPLEPAGLTAFVVNDEVTQLNLLSRLVEMAGLKVQSFESAEAALSALDRARPPVLIVTDIYMPGIDGWRFCRLLKSPEFAAFNRVPILAVSATFSNQDASGIAADLGVEAFLPSPVDSRRFCEQVRAVLRGERMLALPRVLIVEDNAFFCELLKRVFASHGYQVDMALTCQAAADALAKTGYDVALLDHHLPDGSGDTLLCEFRATQPDCACVMMTGDPGPELPVEWMKHGAAAYLHKPFEPALLLELCTRARRERALLRLHDQLEMRTRELRESEERFRSITQNAFDMVAVLDVNGCYLYCNDTSTEILGYSPDELMGRSCFDLIHPDDHECVRRLFESILVGKRLKASVLLKLQHRDGRNLLVDHHARLLSDGQGAPQILLNAQDVTERKRAEAALRKSEEDHRLMADNSVDVILRQAADGTIQYVTPSCEELSGYQAAELIGKPADFLLPSEDCGRVADTIRRQQEQSDQYKTEHRFRRKDGAIIWVETVGRFLRDKSNCLREIQCNFRDITERKRLETALERRLVALTRPLDHPEGITIEELFDLAAIQRIQDEFSAATGVASIITQLDGTPLTRPSNFCRLCKDIIRCTEAGRLNCYRSDAIIGRHHPDGPIIQQCLSGGLWDAGASISVGNRHVANWLIGQVRDETQSEENMREYARNIRADEATVIEAFREVPSMPLAQFKKIAQALFTLANQLSTTAYQNVQQARFIAERQRAEEALQESERTTRTNEQRLLMAQVIGRTGAWELDLATKTLWGSAEAYRMFGLPSVAREFPVDEIESLIPDRTRVHQALMDLVTLGVAYDLEYAINPADGSAPRVVHSMARLERDALGKPVKVQGVIRDITEGKRTEQERTKLETQLHQAQKLESVGRLAGGVAHDFNNMLQVILGNAQLALADIPPTAPAQANLEEIQSCAKRSAELTRQLLAFARKQTIAPKVLELNETVESLLKMLRRLIGEDICLAWFPAAGLGPVRMDPSQLDQILANLCVNARDAIGGVGKVTIETQNAALDETYCADHPGCLPGEYVRLAVSDNGCGMDNATMSHIFEPFFTTKGVGEGTGLGLATVYGIVKQNGGFIDVFSEPGKGTTFTIYLPRIADQALAAKAETATDLALSCGETVLLVEDEPAILAMTRKMLERLGYTVFAANTPTEAIRLVETHLGGIHLLMTDLVMPELNGRDLASRLSSLCPKLKCLFMSGYTADIIARQGVLDESAQFIQKPFSMRDLAAKLRTVLNSAGEA